MYNRRTMINIVVSSRNREAKSAYAIAKSIDSGFVIDCDAGESTTNLTAFFEEIIETADVTLEKHDKFRPIQLRMGNIWFPPIFMANSTEINDFMEEQLPFNLKKIHDEKLKNFFLCPEQIEIRQYQKNIKGFVCSRSEERDEKYFYNHVFLDCSGHLLGSGIFTLEKSIKTIKSVIRSPNIVLHYIMRIHEVAKQKYYNENSTERRREILTNCIRKELENRLTIPLNILSKNNKILVFNLHNENKTLGDRIRGSMLKKDLESIPRQLRLKIPRIQEIYTMETCNGLLGGSKGYHERIYDYLNASVTELPKCLKRIG